MKTYGSLLALSGMASLVHGHGFVTSPQARMPGSAMASACGQQVYSNQESDNYGNVQGELQVAATQSDYNAEECNIWLCKGYKYADNTDNVQSYTAGQTIDMKVDIRAPHTGVANVSIVDTSTDSVIGDPLISWSVYASTATGVTANETSFSITMPSDLGDKCSTAGDCVIQWWWNAASIDQTYESCVDFTVGGSGSGSSSAVASTTAAAATSAVASSTLATVASSTSASATVAVAAASTAAVSTPTAAASSSSGSSSSSSASSMSMQDYIDYFVALMNGLFRAEDKTVHARQVRSVAGRRKI
ncbi:hypothetical protein K490DRAFT_59103 [Saccharata proteae CBS 121410]|uniref:Chitin-binding type-4 domain-containing protein n=1 Tax=Saccharata proteae CBS 121410 TaxID=1314787 RepID=A0A9P4HQA7_9PEZI|nr:hypothetical protein K490DRAFT_59103 [Saccharata proteae CBS 121410]